MVNTGGETIGIATSALSRIAGLAIPAVTIDRVVDEILARDAWLAAISGSVCNRWNFPIIKKV